MSIILYLVGQTCENQEQQMPFTLKKRYGFIPKGMSPLLVETKECNVSLSPTSKRILRKETLKAFEDEVDLVKWKNYINDEGKKFRYFKTPMESLSVNFLAIVLSW